MRQFSGALSYFTAAEGGAGCLAAAALILPTGNASSAPLVAQPPPGGSTRIVRTSADLLSAIADPSVSVALLVAHVALPVGTGEIAIPSGRSLTIAGSAADCQGGQSASPPGVSAAALSALSALPLCTVDAGRQSRVFRVSPGASLTLQSVTVSNGQSAGPGGGIFLSGAATLTLQGSQILDCLSGGYGGGIAGEGGCALSVADSLIALNTGSADGGGLAAVSCASVSVQRSRILNNTAGGRARGGGGALVERTPSAVFDSVVFESNAIVDPNGYAAGGGGLAINAVAASAPDGAAISPSRPLAPGVVIRDCVFRANRRGRAAFFSLSLSFALRLFRV